MTTLTAPPPLVQQAFAWPVRRPLLTAEWRNLAVLNYEVDPTVLAPYAPPGTELDYWEGKAYISIVGFQFLSARLFGVSVPFHANFDEVNLRFYVRRRAADGWRRGVTFIREIAPRRAVALVARLCYGENYVAAPMRHAIDRFEAGNLDDDEAPRRVAYAWEYAGPGRAAVETTGAAALPEPGSHEAFIIEHYWGYSSLSRGRAKEYLVAHPPWRISPAAGSQFQAAVAALYGAPFARYLRGEPASAFWADGSPVRVYSGRRFDF